MCYKTGMMNYSEPLVKFSTFHEIKLKKYELKHEKLNQLKLVNNNKK